MTLAFYLGSFPLAYEPYRPQTHCIDTLIVIRQFDKKGYLR